MSIKAGDKIKDNDPRMTNRILTVMRIWVPLSGGMDQAKAIVNDAIGRPYPILLRRIHTDGKKRRSGFSLLTFDAIAP